jgi:arylsulfatase A-like enzyme
LYHHAKRIPLIVSWPNRLKPGQRRQGACSLLDLGKTIADIAGEELTKDDPLFGRH